MIYKGKKDLDVNILFSHSILLEMLGLQSYAYLHGSQFHWTFCNL